MVKPEANFLREIVAAVDTLKADDLPMPDFDIEAEGYTILGVLGDPDLRAMYVVRSRFSDNHQALAVEQMEYMLEIMKKNPPLTEVASKKNEFKQRGALLSARSEALDELFWTSLKMTFPETVGKSSIAIGKDWKVGWKKAEGRSDGGVLMEILGLM